LKDFRVYAQSFGYKVGDVAHRQELQKLLKQVEGKPEEYAINLALLRSLKQARYSTKPVGHYGLAKKFYTHFTSPIRRYADLLVHRTLLSVLHAGQRASRRYRLEELARDSEHISQTSRVEETGVFPVAVAARETGCHGRRGLHGEEFRPLRRIARKPDAGPRPRLKAGGRFLPVR